MRSSLALGLVLTVQGAPLDKYVTIAPGVEMTTVNLGTCEGLGSDPKVGLVPWLKAGGRGIDTAWGYRGRTGIDWNSPKEIGEILKNQSIPRDKLFITTKIPGGFGNETSCDPDPDIAFRYVQENLDLLQTDYVDLVLIHASCDLEQRMPWERAKAGNAALWKGLKKALDMNLTRAIGVSSFNVTQLEALPSPLPAVNQCQSGVTERDDATIKYCQEKGILYEAFFVMRNCPFDDSRITTIATKYKVSASQVCQRYLLDKGVAMATGTGTDPVKSAKEAVENLAVYSFHLTDEELKIVDTIQKPHIVV